MSRLCKKNPDYAKILEIFNNISYNANKGSDLS